MWVPFMHLLEPESGYYVKTVVRMMAYITSELWGLDAISRLAVNVLFQIVP